MDLQTKSKPGGLLLAASAVAALSLAAGASAARAQDLLQPGENPAAPIHLHLPVHRETPHHASPPSAPVLATRSKAAAAKPAPQHPKAVAQTGASNSAADNSLSFGWAPPPMGATAPHAGAAKSVAKATAPSRGTTASHPAADVVLKAPSRAERRKAVEAAMRAPADTIPSSISSSALQDSAQEMPFSFESTDTGIPSPPSGQTEKTAHPAAKKQAPAHAEFASTQPASAVSSSHSRHRAAAAAESGTKQGEILFPGGAVDPQTTSFAQVKSLAEDLNSALDSSGARVEIDAYGGKPGDKSSDARRLSLRRAIAVRQLLIDNGVPADRIDVRALGGAEDGGHADRVDVMLHAG